MKRRRMKQYIGLVMGILLAVNSFISPLGTMSVLATDEVQDADRGGTKPPIEREPGQLKEGAEQPKEDGAADAPVFDEKETVSDGNTDKGVSDGDVDKDVSKGDVDDSDDDIMLLAEDEEIEPLAASHGTALKNTILKDDFATEAAWKENWTVASDATGKFTYNDGKIDTVAMSGGSLFRMVHKNAGIDAKKFLIQLDITPGFASTSNGSLAIAFKTGSAATENYTQVKFHGADGKIYVEKVSQGTPSSFGSNAVSSALTWAANETLGMDILVDTGANSVTVSVNGEEKVKYTHTEALPGDGNGFAIIRSWHPSNKISIDNLKITTDEAVHISALENDILEDGFATETAWKENWTVASDATGKFTYNDGKIDTVAMSGGSLFRMVHKNAGIDASRFLIQLDIMPGFASTSNGSLAIAFKTDSAATRDYTQVKFHGADGKIYVEKVSQGTPSSFGSNAVSSALTWAANETLGMDILVDTGANSVTVSVNGEEKVKYTHTEALPGDGNGFAIIRSWHPSNKISIDNLKITTDEDMDSGSDAPIELIFPTAGGHANALANVILEDNFANGDNWNVTSSDKVTFGGNKAVMAGPKGAFYCMQYQGAGKIEVGAFLIQMDITPTGAAGAINGDLHIGFKSNATPLKGTYAQVRFDGSAANKSIYVDQYTDDVKTLIRPKTNPTDEDKNEKKVSWNAGQTLKADILVDTKSQTVKVYLDGLLFHTYENVMTDVGSGFYIGREFSPDTNPWTIANLKITTNETADASYQPGSHLPALTYTIASDTFPNGNKWTAKPAEGGSITFAKNAVRIAAGTAMAAAMNTISFKEKLSVGSYLAQLNVRPDFNPGTEGVLQLTLSDKADALDKAVHMMLNFKDKKLVISQTGLTNVGATADFTWAKGKQLLLDVQVDKAAKKLYFYQGGTKIAELDITDKADVDLAYLTIGARGAGHDFSLSSFKVTSAEKAVDPDEGKHAFEKPLNRVLVNDDFTNGNNWQANNANVKFDNGVATIKGSGPCNMMGYNMGIVNAKNMLVQFDLITNAGNNNTSTFVALKLEDAFLGDHLYVRLDPTGQKVWLQRTNDIANAAYNESISYEKAVDYTGFQKDGNYLQKTYGVDILAEGNTIKVYINGEKVLEDTNEMIGTLEKGYFAILGKYPSQNFSIDNLVISTNEDPGPEYTVNVEAATNGTRGDTTGGTVTASAEKGYAGDIITLTAEPAHGYVLDHYESFKVVNGQETSTDGLMPINNNKFALDAKFGNVMVVAYFKPRVPGRFELFYDDFKTAALDAKYKTKGTESGIVQANGVLTISGGTESNYLLLNKDIFTGLKSGDGYRISVDVTRTAGTVQFMFRGADTSIADRHVLGLNGTEAFIKPFVGGTVGDNLKKENYTLGASKTHIVLEVQGNEIICFADGKEILKYTSTDTWKGQPLAAGLINMTPTASMEFDNLLVERIPPMVTLSAKAMVSEGGTPKEDTTGYAGTLRLGSYSAVEKDEVALIALPKAGYRLAECYVEGSDPKVSITDTTYTVPEGAKGSISIVAVFEPGALGDARNYYIDSAGGDDANPGTFAAPWKSFEPLKDEELILAPGSNIYLKRGSIFDKQQFTFNGMGTKEKPITVDAYGEGNLPRLNGGGSVGSGDSAGDVVYLYNQEYITIRNLEITNLAPKFNSDFTLNSSNNRNDSLRAIHIVAKDFGEASGIRIQDCYIHDINGNIAVKWNGGIFLNASADVEGGKPIGVPTWYDDVIIEGCTLINVDRSAIKLVGSGWCGQWEGTGAEYPTWYPSTNVVVRNNYMEKIGGDGITVRDTKGALVEHNLAKDCRYQSTAYNVAIWPFQASGTVIQYNEAYNTHSKDDGQGLDCDHASSYSVMQYNYSHNNEGGFMLIMGGYPHTAVTVRYNISQDDKDKTFEFAQGIPKGTMIYNNTFYSKDVVERGIFYLSNTKAGLGVNDFYAYNNLFCYPAGQPIYGGADVSQLPAKTHLYNNAYVGGVTKPEEEKKDITIADTASVLVNAGSVPEVNDTGKPRTGSSGALDGYKLKAGSGLIDKGVTMEDAIKAFGGNISDIVDARNLSPRDLYEQTKDGKRTSLNCVMGSNYLPVVTGVNYNLDFFGNTNKNGDAPDIGAAEYVQPTSSPSSPSSGGGSSSNTQKPAEPTVKEPEKPVETPAETPVEQPKPADKDKNKDNKKPTTNKKQPETEATKKPDPVPATAEKITVVEDAGEKLPDNMELKVVEVKEEQKAALENHVTAGEHKEVFAGLKMEFVEIQLILTENGGETEVHDKQVTFMISLPKGVTKENHKDYHFFALHLKADGSTELLQPESTENGLRVTSTLSSFALGYGLHEEGEGVTVKEPTEDAEGEMTYSCIGCGTLIRTIAIPALGKKDSAGTSGSSGAVAPEAEADTGNKSMLFIILCLAVLAAGGVGVLMVSKKRKE